MKLKYNLIIALVFLSSCASMINSPFQKVNIDHEPGLSVRIDTTKFYYKDSQIYNVYIPKNYAETGKFFLRCKSDIPLIINDRDTLSLKPHRSSFAFWFANIYTTGGLGMFVDYNNDKSFEYPIYNYIAKDNDKFKNIRFKPFLEKSLKFSLTVPTINFFYIQTDSGKIGSASGLGISGQLDYFIKNNYYLSLNFGATLNPFSPAPDSVYYHSRYYYPFDQISSTNYFNFRINKITPRFEYGIGLSLATLKWSANNIFKSTDTTRFYNQSYYKSLNLGFSSDFTLRLTPNFNIGLQYQPYFFDLRRKKYTYQHFITSQMIWRF
jgi:hypothetical protein